MNLVMNQNQVDLKITAKMLASLPHWNEGTNHLLFNMLPGSAPQYHTTLDVDRNKAILAGGGFSTWSYRRTYDVAIPVLNPAASSIELSEKPYKYVISKCFDVIIGSVSQVRDRTRKSLCAIPYYVI